MSGLADVFAYSNYAILNRLKKIQVQKKYSREDKAIVTTNEVPVHRD